MNPQIKTVLLTVLTLSVFVIALVELSGVSKNAFYNKWYPDGQSPKQIQTRDQQVSAMPKTTMKFIETSHSFGNINEGDMVKYDYRFVNTGNQPLLISKTDVTCGCTVPSFSKEPVPPGGEGQITVQYNSSNHPGHQQKNIIVHSNAVPDAVSIGFEADVKAK